LYDKRCTSDLREQTDPNCLYYKEVRNEAAEIIDAILQEKTFTEENEKKQERLNLLKQELVDIIDDAAKKCGTKKKEKKKKKSKKG
jgi:hypothetical protein